MKRGSCISPLRPDKEHAILEFLLFYVYTTAIIIQSVFNKYKIKSFEVSIMWFGNSRRMERESDRVCGWVTPPLRFPALYMV